LAQNVTRRRFSIDYVPETAFEMNYQRPCILRSQPLMLLWKGVNQLQGHIWITPIVKPLLIPFIKGVPLGQGVVQLNRHLSSMMFLLHLPKNNYRIRNVLYLASLCIA